MSVTSIYDRFTLAREAAMSAPIRPSKADHWTPAEATTQLCAPCQASKQKIRKVGATHVVTEGSARTYLCCKHFRLAFGRGDQCYLH